MLKIIKNRMILNTFILTIYTFIIEMVIRIYTHAAIFDFASVRILLSSMIFASIISFITHFTPKLVARIIHIIYVLGIGILAFVEFGLHNYLGFFMGIGNTEQGTKVMSYILDFLNSLSFVHYLIIIPIILFVLYYIFIDKLIMKNYKKNTKFTKAQKIYIEAITVVFIISLCGIYYAIVRNNVMQNELQNESNYAVWLYPENSNLSVNNYGVVMYIFTDIKANILDIGAEDVFDLESDTKEDINVPVDKPVTDYTRVIDDTAWKKLIENTTDKNFNILNNYFINREITDKNEYTGIFEGKNLILILMESVNETAILNGNDFPTLRKLYDEGISFRNNFTPRNNCSTGNNEFTALTSLFTINNACTANDYKNNKYFEAAFNLFRNKGYYATSYHDYTQQYYYRRIIHENLGSQKFYSVTDLGIPYNAQKYEEWPSDVDMFKQSKQFYMSEDKFMSYFATVSTHQTYNVPSELGDKYKDEFTKQGYSTTLSRYLSKMKTLDEALEELLNELESEGKLENTVIALFADHYPYGLNDAQVNEYLTKNNAGYTVNKAQKSKGMDIDRTPMIIYNAGMGPLAVNEYTTILDLLPTLFNMFNIDYDPRLYMGTDIFSKSHNSRAVFADGSWQTDKAYYYSPGSKITYYDKDFEYSKDELKKINTEITNRQKMSALAIKSNYFNYLGEGLKKYQVKDKNNEEDSVVE